MFVRPSSLGRRGLTGLLLLALALVQGVAFAIPTIQSWTTVSGGRVLFVPTEGLPVVDVRMVFDAGSARDGEAYGLANLTAALLMSGAGPLDADAIAERLEEVGAQLSVNATRESTQLALRTLSSSRELEASLAVFRDVVSSPRFDQKDVDRERARVLQGIQQRSEDPGEIADLAFMRALYGNHPYAHPVEGERETVQPLDGGRLSQFHRDHYTVSNGLLVLVGDLNRAKAEAIATMLYAGLQTGSAAPPIEEPQNPGASAPRIIPFPSEQTHVLTGTLGVRADDPDYFPLVVGNHVLGGSGLVSKIMEEVREKRGLAYSAYSYFMPMRRPGPYQIGLQSKNASAKEALDVAVRTLREFIEQGPTEAALAAAKQNLVGGFVLRLDSNLKLIGEVAAMGFLNRPLDWLSSYPSRVERVTREAVRDAFRRRIDPQRFQTVLVGGSSVSEAAHP